MWKKIRTIIRTSSTSKKKREYRFMNIHTLFASGIAIIKKDCDTVKLLWLISITHTLKFDLFIIDNLVLISVQLTIGVGKPDKRIFLYELVIKTRTS